jgi:hypothetical protein
VLDDVERRRLLIDPAGEYAPPLPVAALHLELEEGSGELLALPRRRRLARQQPDYGIFQPHRLSRPHRQIPDDPVAFVENADHRDSLGHRSDPGFGSGEHIGALRLFRLLLFGRLASAATGENERKHDHQRPQSHRDYSGIQG